MPLNTEAKLDASCCLLMTIQEIWFEQLYLYEALDHLHSLHEQYSL